jgi:hypothetical protein
MSDSNERTNLGNPVQLLSGMGEVDTSNVPFLFEDEADQTKTVGTPDPNPPPENVTAPKQFSFPTKTPFTAQAPIRALHLLPGGGMKSKTVHDVAGAGKTTLPLVKGAAGAGAIAKIIAWAKANPALALGGAAAVWYFFLRQPRGSGVGGFGDFGDFGDTRRTLDSLKRKGRR